jgi:hypothetical protein
VTLSSDTQIHGYALARSRRSSRHNDVDTTASAMRGTDVMKKRCAAFA